MRAEELYEALKKQDLTHFAGVPDSTFKAFMSYLNDHDGEDGLTNVIACNECEAVAEATGYHLATNKVPVVYMQNAGFGKTVNPVTSLADPEVYSIPMVMLIGWRGEPGKKDEPQHMKMGRVTLPLLETLEIPYQILPAEAEEAAKVIAEMKQKAVEGQRPAALVIRKGALEAYNPLKVVKTDYEMNREDAIMILVDNLAGGEAIVSTTGKTSRELFEHRISRGEFPRDFYTVGSMGCSASIALGIAGELKEKDTLVFDGDGAVIMQMGALATIGSRNPKNLYHIVFDNQAYDSTGGQPTVSGSVDICKVAMACGYKGAERVSSKAGMVGAVKKMKDMGGPYLLVVDVNKGARKDLGRPTTTPIENKKGFMEYLQK